MLMELTPSLLFIYLALQPWPGQLPSSPPPCSDGAKAALPLPAAVRADVGVRSNHSGINYISGNYINPKAD